MACNEVIRLIYCCHSYMYMKYCILAEVYVCDERRFERLLHVFQRLIDPVEGPDERFVN